MLEGLKHFAVVGLGFALVVGWVATILVNQPLGMLLETVLHAPPEKDFLGSALLTALSVTLILVCIAVGNRLFRRWFPTARLSRSALLFSSAAFLLVVLVLVVPQFGQVMSAYASHTHYFYHHGSELLLMLSLPLARLVLLPFCYFFISQSALRST